MVININGNNVNFDEVVDVFDTHGPYCSEVEVHGFNISPSVTNFKLRRCQMTMQEVLNRVNDIIDNHNHHELNLLRNDLEDDIIWENKMNKYKPKGK